MKKDIHPTFYPEAKVSFFPPSGFRQPALTPRPSFVTSSLTSFFAISRSLVINLAAPAIQPSHFGPVAAPWRLRPAATRRSRTGVLQRRGGASLRGCEGRVHCGRVVGKSPVLPGTTRATQCLSARAFRAAPSHPGRYPQQGNNSAKLQEDSRVKDFNARFGDLQDTLGTVAKLPPGKAVIPEKARAMRHCGPPA